MRLSIETGRCPICQQRLKLGWMACCSDCGVPYHAACMGASQPCLIYGCHGWVGGEPSRSPRGLLTRHRIREILDSIRNYNAAVTCRR